MAILASITKSKLNFHVFAVDSQIFLWIHNFKFKQIAMTMWNFIEIYWLDVLLNWARKSIFLRFFWFRNFVYVT